MVKRFVLSIVSAVIEPFITLTPSSFLSFEYIRSDWIRYGNVLPSCSAVALL